MKKKVQNMPDLTKRQTAILDFVREKGPVSNREIKDYIGESLERVTRMTIVRDLDALEEAGLAFASGKGRSLVYNAESINPLLKFIDPDQYFSKEADKRILSYSSFNFDIFDKITDIFNEDEIQELKGLNKGYLLRSKKLSKGVLEKEFERLTIELAWKSSHIEGNTYTLLDTERLIKQKQEAKGHDHSEAVMILNHKKALEYIHKNSNLFKNLNLTDIQKVHKVLIDGLGVPYGFRDQAVGILGTRYKPINNKYKIQSALDETFQRINKIRNPWSKALLAVLMTSYIQPFEDGNKRTGRLMGYAVLLAHNICPPSYRSIDEVEYKKAVILFYEQNDASYFKELFIQQFRFAIENYFQE
ncbi:MAG: Fic family protein [Parcubacteria group bacterium]